MHSAGSLGPLQLEENNNNNDQLEQDIDDQSQDGDKDLLLLDDRFADSGMQSYISQVFYILTLSYGIHNGLWLQ